MQPEIHLGPLTLQTFGIAFALAFIAAGAVLGRRLKELGKPTDWAYELVFSALVGGIVGARLDFIIQNYDAVKDDLLGNLFSGSGLVWYGGAIGGAIGVGLWAWRRKMLNLALLDICAAPLALGYAIGRIGCQVSGDGDYGKAWDGPWAMAYPHGTKPIDTTGPPDADLRDARHGPRRLLALAPARPLSSRASSSRSTSCSPAPSGFLVEFIRRNTPESPRPHAAAADQRGDDDRRRHLAGGKGPPRRAHARRRRRDRAEQGAGLAVLPPRSVPTGPAGPVEHDVVLGDLKTHLAGQPIDGLLELLVVERNHPPADIADEVMVMIASGHERLVPGDSLADLQSPHELHVGQQLERPVDAREPHAVALPPQAGLDLRRGERARLLRQQVDNRQPRLTLPEPRRLQLVDRALAPCGPRIVHRVRAYPGSRPPAAGPVPRMRRDARTAQAPMLTSA